MYGRCGLADDPKRTNRILSDPSHSDQIPLDFIRNPSIGVCMIRGLMFGRMAPPG
jgi:hypothetical protein